MCATLVDEWIALGVRLAMIAPGSRSTPVALALAARPEVRIEVFLDERSAAFAALGAGAAAALPAIAQCTSGTAATHFHAAVAEADLSGVPLIVVTADRPPELHGVGAPQTIEQHRLYGAKVRWAVDLAPPTAGERWVWRYLAASLVARATGARPGPVHLNLGLREPLLGRADELPRRFDASPPVADVPHLDAELDGLAPSLDVQRGVIVAGAGAGPDAAVGELSGALGWPVLADPQSRCRGLAAAVSAFDAILRHPDFARDHAPTAVLQLGMPPASKVLGQWLASAPGTVHVAVSGRGLVSDPLLVGARQVHAHPAAVCAAIVRSGIRGGRDTPWSARWRTAERIAQAAFDELLDGDGELSDPAVGRAVSRLPADVRVVVSSSMPVRDLEWFGAPGRGPIVLSNRGANGIDGVLATAIGVAATGVRTVAWVGDVALLHDASSLAALARRPVDLTILVTDNDGGAIFSFLPQATAVSTERFELLFGTPHGTDLAALALAHGIDATQVTTREGLRAALDRRGIRLVLVRTDRAANVALHRRLNDTVVTRLR